MYRGYQHGISPGSRHIPGRGSTHSADPLATCCFKRRCDVLLGCSFGIDREEWSRRVLLPQPVVPRLVCWPLVDACVCSLSDRQPWGVLSFVLCRRRRRRRLSSFSLFPGTVERPSSATCPRSCSPGIAEAGRVALCCSVLLASSSSHRRRRLCRFLVVPRRAIRPRSSPGVPQAVTQPSFSLVAALFLLRFPRSSYDRARCAPMLPHVQHVAF